MADPITTEDLYGTSKDQAPAPSEPLQYEETPEIPMAPPTPVKKSGSPVKAIGVVVAFAALFVAGIWVSGYLRDLFSSNRQSSRSAGQSPLGGTTPAPTEKEAARPNDPYADWISYDIISSVTKKAVPGMSFKLPADVLSPICDGVGCLSQGTYLPGGTRFTVAARGANQALKDYRGATITDVNGKAFTTKQVTVKGLTGAEFAGTFAGRTVAGYTFTRMRGVMVETSATTSIEINHFTPQGIVADFEKDDTIFDQILNTLTISAGAIPIATSTPKPATSSGY